MIGHPTGRFTLSALLLLTFGLVVFLFPLQAEAKKKAAPAAADWPEITPEERKLKKVEQDPEADAVVLRKSRDGKIIRKADDWVNVLEFHWRLKVLTERGERFAEVRIPSQKASRVTNLRARTIKPDGMVVAVEPDQMFEKIRFQVGSYKVTDLVFNFPAVEPGAILEYRYDRHSDFLFYIDPWFFAGEEFTLKSRVSQVIPIKSSYSILCDLCPDVKPEISKWREGKMKGQKYLLELSDIPGYRDEILMPPPREVSPRLEMVLQAWKGYYWASQGRQDDLFIDWPSVATYAGYYYGETIKDGQEQIKPLVAQWTEGISDPDARIAAVLKHVREDFRYLSYTQVVGASRSIEAIVKQKIADNEEKGVLLLAALKALDVEAYPALVVGKDLGSLNPKFFSPSQFTHTIVGVVGAGGEMEWLDPTVAYAPPGFLPWKDSGAGALLINGTQGELLGLPMKNELSTTEFEVAVTPLAGGRAELELQAKFVGEDAIDLREDLLPASESTRTSLLQEWVENHRPGASLKSHTLENLSDVDKPLVMKMSLEAPDLVTIADGTYVVRGCVMSGFESNPLSRTSRTHPFYIDRGWNKKEIVTIKAPSGTAPGALPPPAVAKSAIGSMRFNCYSKADTVRCTRHFVVRRNRWAAEENGAIRQMFDTIVKADQSSVVFEAGGS